MKMLRNLFQREGFEFYGPTNWVLFSDQPKDQPGTARFVERSGQVRQAIGADSNFYLLGNSWGGLLAAWNMH